MLEEKSEKENIKYLKLFNSYQYKTLDKYTLTYNKEDIFDDLEVIFNSFVGMIDTQEIRAKLEYDIREYIENYNNINIANVDYDMVKHMMIIK